MTFCTHPRDIAAFRKATAEASMPGVASSIPKLAKCSCCGVRRVEKTGTQTAAGFICGMCDGAWAKQGKAA